jgi:hypothetical protein
MIRTILFAVGLWAVVSIVLGLALGAMLSAFRAVRKVS